MAPDPPRIPFNKPLVTGGELDYVAAAVRNGRIGSDGEFTARCSRLLEERFGLGKVLMTTSCTSALELSVLLAGIGPGDEVLMPSFTFVSTAGAVVRAGGRPRFADVRPDTLNLDESQLESRLTPRTKAVVAVHYAGVGCEMDAVNDFARRHGLTVIEDAAQGIDAAYRDQPLGSLGRLAAYSFHETKNCTCGEGGALVVNDEALVERAEILRHKGTNRSQFLRGQVDKYRWVDAGSSYAPSDLVCAYLLAQLESLEEITARRLAACGYYRRRLAALAADGRVRLPEAPPHCRSNGHLFYLLAPTARVRDELIEHLRQRQIQAVFHYVPLHNSPMGRRLGTADDRLPVTEEVSERLLRLPLFGDIRREQQDRVVEALESYFR